MAWDAFHRRDAALKRVLEVAELRQDGVLPWDDELAAAFGTTDRLLGALQMRWHTRLSGAVEWALVAQPHDLQAAVISAWRAVADEMPGLRRLLDSHPDSTVLRNARRKDWLLLATASAVAGLDDPAAAHLGELLEQRAREAVPA